MSETLETDGTISWTAVDLVERFGPIPLHRVCSEPRAGTATEEDVLRLYENENRLYELVDGTLLEKTVGTYESYLALVIARHLSNFVAEKNLGIVLGADGMLRIAPSLIRIPDVSFIEWDRLPDRRVPRDPIAAITPNLAVEVISRSNTQQEMDRKLQEYLSAGVQLIWYVYPESRSVHVFEGDVNVQIVSITGSIVGRKSLTGFKLPLASLFDA